MFISPKIFWPAVFTSYAIPGLLIINFILLFALPFIRKRLVIFPITALLIGSPFIIISYSNKGDKASKPDGLSVLSFNTKLFRKLKTYEEFSFDIIKWAATDTSGIKCFQEYSTNDRWEVLDVTKQISDEGYHSFTFSADLDDAEHNPGLAIFSTYDILDSGIVWKNYGSSNAGIFIDIKYNQDRIRIYNVHLASMRLRLYQYKNVNNYVGKLKRLISSLKNGAQARSNQINKLITHAQNCPYPYIICGDFNETPYSYNYFKMKRNFSNSFEEAGNGFGFTLNSALFFLRIDHTFFDDEIEAIDFRVDRTMRISDHFPTRGYYHLRK